MGRVDRAARAGAHGVVLAVPGRLETPTGGYEYARRVLAESAARDGALVHWPLPMLGPRPDEDGVDEAIGRLAMAPAGWPLLIDGLALGMLPAEAVASLDAPVAALVHHPLALEQGLDPGEADWLAANERATLGVCARVIATSEATARTLATDYAVAPDLIAVARPGTARPPRARGPVAMPSGPVRLLSVGTLTPRKGHDVLLAALARISGEAGTDWRLTVLGDATRDPACAAALAAETERLGLAGRVAFVGSTSREDVEAAYAGHDLFVLASRLEGYGMAYAEAMAAGLPVVGTTAGAIAEATLGAARLVPPDDPAALAATLAPLIADPDARAALAEDCRAAGRRLPDWPDTLEAIMAAMARFGVGAG